MDTPSATDRLSKQLCILVAELLVFAVLLFVWFIVGSLLCPYDVLTHSCGTSVTPFKVVMMLGFFLGVPLASALCCLALRREKPYPASYPLSLAVYVGLSYAYGYLLFVCDCCRLLSLSDAYLLILIFPMLYHLLVVPFLLLLNAWLSYGKLPAELTTARRFGRHALLMLAALWGISALTTLLPRL